MVFATQFPSGPGVVEPVLGSRPLDGVLDVVQLLAGCGTDNAVVEGIVVLKGRGLKLRIDGADGAAGFPTPPDEPKQQDGSSEHPDQDQGADQQGEQMVCSGGRENVKMCSVARFCHLAAANSQTAMLDMVLMTPSTYMVCYYQNEIALDLATEQANNSIKKLVVVRKLWLLCTTKDANL